MDRRNIYREIFQCPSGCVLQINSKKYEPIVLFIQLIVKKKCFEYLKKYLHSLK